MIVVVGLGAFALGVLVGWFVSSWLYFAALRKAGLIDRSGRFRGPGLD